MIDCKNELVRSVLATIADPPGKRGYELTPGYCLTIQPLSVQTDLPVLHDWVNQPYAIPFWQMNGSYQLLLDTYTQMAQDPAAQSFTGYLNGTFMAQVDLYDPLTDSVRMYYNVCAGDVGIHVLIAPGPKPVRHFSQKLLYCFLDFFFQSHLVQRIIGEPDERNAPANRMLQNLSFRLLKPMQLPHKNAFLYEMTRRDFSRLSQTFPCENAITPIFL